MNVVYFDDKTKIATFPFANLYSAISWLFKIKYEKMDDSDLMNHLRLRFYILGIKMPLFLRYDNCKLNKNGDYDCTGHLSFMPFKFKLIHLKNAKF